MGEQTNDQQDDAKNDHDDIQPFEGVLLPGRRLPSARR
jgi:hypothetical protein